MTTFSTSPAPIIPRQTIRDILPTCPHFRKETALNYRLEACSASEGIFRWPSHALS